jgi:hypothetical protein
MSAPAAPPRFDIGRVFSRLFGVLGRNLASFLALSALLVGLPTAALRFAQLSLNAFTSPPVILSNFATIALVGGLVSVVANAILQGAVIHGTVSDLAGKRASFSDCLGTGTRFFLPLVGIGVVSGLAVGFGLVVFIAPGVLLWLAWMVAAPAEVIERRGVFGALSRSAELTHHHRGAILGLAAIYFVIVFVAQGAVTAMAVSVGSFAVLEAPTRAFSPLTVVQTLVTLIVQTLKALVSSAGVASVYYELRAIKEGVGAQQLAAVFD